MQRALVVINAADTEDIQPTEASRDLVRMAGELAAGVGAEVYLLHVTTEADYQERTEAYRSLPELEIEYDVVQAAKGAGQFAANVANTVLADLDVEFRAIGRLGEVEDEVLEVAEEYDCDHLFITGRRRSPTGKAIFGDVTQALILNFDGPVTVTTT